MCVEVLVGGWTDWEVCLLGDSWRGGADGHEKGEWGCLAGNWQEAGKGATYKAMQGMGNTKPADEAAIFVLD